MLLRRAIAHFLLLPTVVIATVSSRALGAEAAGTKEACLSAADEGQSLRDDSKHMLAREQFLACARDVCPRLVRDQCTEWLRQLDEATPTVVFGAKDNRGNDVTSARVTSDGKLVTDHLDGKPVALDPGPHDIVFEREGAPPATVHVVLQTGEKNRNVSPTNPYLLLLNTMGGPEASNNDGRSARFLAARNIASLSLLAAGVVGVGAGVAFGLESRSQADQATSLRMSMPSYACASGSPPGCRALGDAVDAQNRDAVLSDVFYVAGGVLAGAAAATWLLWPRPHRDRPTATWLAPTAGEGRVGLSVGGVF